MHLHSPAPSPTYGPAILHTCESTKRFTHSRSENTTKKFILVSFLAHKHHASTIMISIILQSPSHPHMRQYLPIPSDYRSHWLLSKGEALVKPLRFMRFSQFPRKLPTNMLDDDIPDVVFLFFYNFFKFLFIFLLFVIKIFSGNTPEGVDREG